MKSQRDLITVLLGVMCGCALFTKTAHSQPTKLTAPSSRVTLSKLPAHDVKHSGEQLMKLPLGLHLLSEPLASHLPSKDALPKPPLPSTYVFVHGYKSRGYEWIYPAHSVSKTGELYFWRWNWTLCPREAADHLAAQLKQLSNRPQTQKLIVIGHSYGGLILAQALMKYEGERSIEAHVIAAPLAGHPSLEARCGDEVKGTSRPIRPQAELIQWVTHKDLDGAFKSLNFDAQKSEAPHLRVRLARAYRSKRLGHNWSISAVVDRLMGCAKQFAQDRLMCFKQLGERESDPDVD